MLSIVFRDVLDMGGTAGDTIRSVVFGVKKPKNGLNNTHKAARRQFWWWPVKEMKEPETGSGQFQVMMMMMMLLTIFVDDDVEKIPKATHVQTYA